MAKKKNTAPPATEYKFDHEFVPTGYNEQDKCQICGAWTTTWSGLNSLAKEVFRSGSTSGVLYHAYCDERRKAIAHKIASPEGIIITDDDFPLGRLIGATEENKERQQQNSSDIGIDSDTSRQEGGKSVKKTKKKQVKTKVTDLQVNSIVLFGDKPGTKESLRIKGKVVRRNISKGKNSMALVKNSATGEEAWVPENCLWVAVNADRDRPTDRINTQTGIWSDDADFSAIELLVPYVGMHV